MKKEYLEPKATLLVLLTGDIMSFSAGALSFVDGDAYVDGQEYDSDRKTFEELFGLK